MTRRRLIGVFAGGGVLLALTRAVATEPDAAPFLRVVATIFPLYDWARIVGGPSADVRQLLPAGAEVHGYAPTPADVAAVRAAHVFIYAGPDLEPWADRLDVRPDCAGLRRLAAGQCLRPRPTGDPHFWTDPVAAITVVRGIADAMADLDPAGADGYRARANAYAEDLRRLHEDFAAMVATARSRTVMLGGHAAFGALGERYGITFVSPYAGFSPDTPPSPRAMAELIDRMKQTRSTVVFHEELVDPRVARAIARETGAELRLLHGLHNRTPEEVRRGETYLTLQRRNLEEMRRVLCPR